MAHTPGQAGHLAEHDQLLTGFTDKLTLGRLLSQSVHSARAGAGQSGIDYADAAETDETWANLTAWTTADVAVSGNKLVASGTANPSAAVLPFSVPDGAKAHARLVLHYKGSPASSAIAMFGVDCGASGHAPAASSPDAFLVGLFGTTGRAGIVGANLTGVTMTSDGEAGAGTNPGATDTDYACSIDVDETCISVSLQKVGSTTDSYGWKIARSQLTAIGKTVNNLIVYLADARGGAGHTFGPVAAVHSQQPARSKALAGVTVEGGDPRHVLTRNPSDATRPFHFALPASYDPRRPAPLVIVPHQAASGTSGTPFSESSFQPVTAALLGAGYIVVGVADTTGAAGSGDSWGNQASLDNHLAVYQYMRDRFSIGPVFLIGPSMGTLISLNLLAQRRFPTPAAFASICGAYSIADIYSRDSAFDAGIRTAYGVASDGSDLVAKTAGFDPATRAGWEFRGVPMRYYAAGADALAPPAQHGAPLIAAVAPHTEDASLVTVAGVAHLDVSTYQAANLLAFFESHRTGL